MIRVLQGDCRNVLKTLPNQSVQCVVTSPPYFGLRDYGVDGQIGLEPTPEAFVAEMVEVFREVRRVLRDDGTCWLNLGDSYAGSRCGPQGRLGEMADRSIASQREMRAADGNHHARQGAKPKDLLMIPARVALALQADGWLLRSDIIWAKPNPMPESVIDRPTSAHEHVFLLTKAKRYCYDAEAVREPITVSSVARLSQDVENQTGSARANGGAKINGPMKAVAKGNAKSFRGGGAYTGGKSFYNATDVPRETHGNEPNSSGFRNLRDVWTIASHPFAEAHFATFPPKLAERCIMAGSRKGDAILDPFAGAGTVGLVADRLQRDAVLIELNPDYVEIINRRITGDAGLFAELS